MKCNICNCEKRITNAISVLGSVKSQMRQKSHKMQGVPSLQTQAKLRICKSTNPISILQKRPQGRKCDHQLFANAILSSQIRRPSPSSYSQMRFIDRTSKACKCERGLINARSAGAPTIFKLSKTHLIHIRNTLEPREL